MLTQAPHTTHNGKVTGRHRYDATKGIVPPAKVIVRGLAELRKELAALESKPSLSPEDKQKRLQLFDAVKELTQDEAQITKALSILFSEPALKRMRSLLLEHLPM